MITQPHGHRNGKRMRRNMWWLLFIGLLVGCPPAPVVMPPAEMSVSVGLAEAAGQYHVTRIEVDKSESKVIEVQEAIVAWTAAHPAEKVVSVVPVVCAQGSGKYSYGTTMGIVILSYLPTEGDALR